MSDILERALENKKQAIKQFRDKFFGLLKKQIEYSFSDPTPPQALPTFDQLGAKLETPYMGYKTHEYQTTRQVADHSPYQIGNYNTVPHTEYSYSEAEQSISDVNEAFPDEIERQLIQKVFTTLKFAQDVKRFQKLDRSNPNDLPTISQVVEIAGSTNLSIEELESYDTSTTTRDITFKTLNDFLESHKDGEPSAKISLYKIVRGCARSL